MTKQLEKPEAHTSTHYEYSECRDYLQQKYGYQERDYKGRFRSDSLAEYCDFWHWVCDNHEVHNGVYIYFSQDELKDLIDRDEPDWVIEIYRRYVDEFADKDGTLKLWVEW